MMSVRFRVYQLMLASLLLQGLAIRIVQADELADLSRLVCGFSERYSKDISNVQFDFSNELTDSGDSYEGQATIHMGVRPHKFPKHGAFFCQFINKNGGKEVIRVGNSQYSFRLDKPEGSPAFTMSDLVVQSNEESIYSAWRPKSHAYTWMHSVHCAVVFAPITVMNIPTEELFTEDGIERKLISIDSDKSVVEFSFPPGHISKHTHAIVSFGKNGEVLESKVYQHRTEVDLHVWYTLPVTYSTTEKTASGFPLPGEKRQIALAILGGETIKTSPVTLKASNYHFENRDIEEFTLSHFGFPEPEGTTLLKKPVP